MAASESTETPARAHIVVTVLYKDEALVLRTMRLGEADRIVTFMGRAGGKIRGVAKGVRKTKSRFGGRLEPFSYVSLVLWRGRSGLDTVTQVEVLDSHRAVREDLNRFVLGQVMLEAVDKVVQDAERSPRLFSLLLDGLRGLSTEAQAGSSREDRISEPPMTLVLTSFLLRLCAISGFGASLKRCAECRSPAVWFSPGQGGAVCGRCRAPDAEEVSPGVLELMSDVATDGPWMKVDDELVRTSTRLSRYYTEYHLERRLRSATTADSIL